MTVFIHFYLLRTVSLYGRDCLVEKGVLGLVSGTGILIMHGGACFPIHPDKDGSIFLSLRSNGMTLGIHSGLSESVSIPKENYQGIGTSVSFKVHAFSWRNLRRIGRLKRTGEMFVELTDPHYKKCGFSGMQNCLLKDRS